MTRRLLAPEPLTGEAFAAFGDVIETRGHRPSTINDGQALRFNDLATIDVLAEHGRPLLNIFRARPWPAPIRIRMMERHPLSSQAFVPLAGTPFLILVAPPGDRVTPETLHLFRSAGRQGVNYRRGAWHHPLLALEQDAEFLVIDRGGRGANCDLWHLDASDEIILRS